MEFKYIHLRKYWLIASLCWMALIFFLSARPADLSSQDSLFFATLFDLLIPSSIDIEAFASILGFSSFHAFVRKLAHFTIYSVLGILFYKSIESTPPTIWLPWSLATLYAISDEIHQFFVPGRACLVSDMIIDSLGALLGIILIHLFYHYKSQ